ncbi:putative acetyltransferase [Rosellinia necatrix]|uniref:Putative acetyltransferase n=1 Tax=Rosellinia necatrix TaxID=77044 RepID=A0A1S8AAP0_ROSNE|nr:putative acetyltransferase [Rosellinia necatrix]
MAFIRPYKDSDFDACAHICIATLPPTLASSPEAAKLSPYLWTHPYTFLSPATCHVLDDGEGRAVGYCIGCPDVHAFVADYERYVSAVLSRHVPEPDFGAREPWLKPAHTTTTITTTTTTTATTIKGDDEAGEEEMVVNPLALAQSAYRAD